MFVETKEITKEKRSSKDVKLVEKSSSVKEDVTASRVHSSEERAVPIPVVFKKDTPKTSGKTKTLCL